MRNIHALFWRDALRGLRAAGGGARTAVAPSAMAEEPVREERLRAAAGIEGGVGLSAWRGRSGRRIVVAVHPLGAVDPADLDGAVALAVARPDGAPARVIAATTAESVRTEARRRAWLERVAARGAVEVHLHRLADGPQARRAVAADLGGRPETPSGRGDGRRRAPRVRGARTGLLTEGAGPGTIGKARDATRDKARDQPGPSRRGTRR
ncbi:MAG: hypothetical protein ACFE0R_04315 [Salinarimonas sp.]